MILVSRQSAHRWLSYKSGHRLPLLSARPTVTFSAAEHQSPLAGTKLYCLVTETHVCVNNLPKVDERGTTWVNIMMQTMLHSTYPTLMPSSMSVGATWSLRSTTNLANCLTLMMYFGSSVSALMIFVQRATCRGCSPAQQHNSSSLATYTKFLACFNCKCSTATIFISEWGLEFNVPLNM